MPKNINHNIRWLIENRYKSQQEFANAIGVSSSAVTKYVSGETQPKPKILNRIRDIHGYSIDTLLNEKLDEATSSSLTGKVINVDDQKPFDRLIGSYATYYFNTNKNFLGSNSLKSALKYGILVLYKRTDENTGMATYHSIAILGLTNEQLSLSFNKTKLEDISYVREHGEKLSKTEHVYFYEGTYDIMRSSVYIDLVNESKEKVSLIFPYHNSEKEYIGGLGTVNSISRGGDHDPCVQLIGISKKLIIDTKENVIAEYLLMNEYDFDFKEETRFLIGKFKHFYGAAQDNPLFSALSPEEKEVLMEHNVQLMMKKIFQNRMQKIGYLSKEQEKAFYKFIKGYNR